MKAKILQVLLLVAIVFTLNSCSTNATETPVAVVASSSKTASYDYSSNEIDTMNLINDYRVSVGLKALSKINYVSLKSEEHDNEMIADNTVSHNGFVARSEDIMKVLGATTVSENVAYNYNTPQAAVEAWLNSPAHKVNIVGDYTNFGISIRLDSAGRKYYTNIFVKI